MDSPVVVFSCDISVAARAPNGPSSNMTVQCWLLRWFWSLPFTAVKISYQC